MKKSILLLFCILTLSWSSAFAEYGFGNCTLSFSKYTSNEQTINSPFSITFDDPNIIVSINDKKYTYFVEILSQALEDYLMFYTTEDKKNYIGLTRIDDKIYILIATPELKFSALSYACNEPSKLSSFYKKVKTLFLPKVMITGYIYSVFSDQQIIIGYKYRIINGKGRKFRRMLYIYDDDNSNVTGSFDLEESIIIPESNDEELTIREPILLSDYEARHYERPGVMGLTDGTHKLGIFLKICDKEHPDISSKIDKVEIPVTVKNGKISNPDYRKWNW